MVTGDKGYHPDIIPDCRSGRGSYRRILAGVVALCVIVFVPYASAVQVEIGDEIYNILERLEAEGLIKSALLTTRPLSRKEAARLVSEAQRNVEDKKRPFQKYLISSLKDKLNTQWGELRYLKPVEKAYSGYIYSDQAGQELNYNNDGDTYNNGSNFRLSITSLAELGAFSFYLNPELRYYEDETDVVLKKAYAALSLWGLELEAGKDSQWWGPGHHGAILLSNNAEPLTMLKLTNPHPVLLPWVLKYLGPFRFSFFASKLGKRRVVAEPYLWGLRFNFKPVPYVEFGLQRTAMLGGKGRSEGLGTWWKSFTGEGENEFDTEAGDQRAGGDIKITLPFKTQPLQLYAEAAGEDEAGGLPIKWAYLTGIYLPRVSSIERLSFRAEYANTRVNRANVWYNHHIYRSGYTYDGRVLGHHMGTDSDDLFFELSYLLPEWDGGVKFSYDRERHNRSGSQESVKEEASINVRLDVTEDLRLKGGYSLGMLKDAGNKDISLFSLSATYRF